METLNSRVPNLKNGNALLRKMRKYHEWQHRMTSAAAADSRTASSFDISVLDFSEVGLAVKQVQTFVMRRAP